MDEKTRTRQNASRAARVARGERQVAVWLQPIAVDALALLSEGADATHAINRALVECAAQEVSDREEAAAMRALGAARAGVV